MNAVFDTLAYANKLQEAGVAPEVAKVHATALAEVAEEKFATRVDVANLDQKIINLDQKIERVRQELKNDMVCLEERLSHKIEIVAQRIDAVNQRFDQRFELVNQRFEEVTRQIENVTYKLTVRLGSLMTAGIFVIGALHKLFN